MNKFETLLSADNAKIIAQRAKFISEDGKIAAEDAIRVLTNRKRELERELAAISDLYPTSALSLMVTKDKFDAKKWWDDRRKIRIELLNLEVELDDANEDFNEWFGDTESTVEDTKE